MRIDGPTQPAAPSHPATATIAAVAGASRTRSLDLTVTTRDGDVVTISAASATTVGAAATSGAGATSAAVVGATSTTLSVSVHGTLDRDELRDLRRILKTLTSAANGRSVRALGREHPGHGRRRGPSLDTIAGISGTLQQSAAVIGGVLVLAPAATGPTTPPPQDPDATASPADTTVPSPLDPTAPPDGTDPASTTPPAPATAL